MKGTSALTLEWTQQTRNTWTAEFAPGLELRVYRSPSWRRLKAAKPFRVDVFTDRFTDLRFDELVDAQRAAELEGRQRLERVEKQRARSACTCPELCLKHPPQLMPGPAPEF